MVEIVWLPKAIERLQTIHTFYLSRSKKSANLLKKDIITTAKLLHKHPEIGSIEPNLSDLPICFRSLIVRNNYKVIYYISDKTVYIATIWDCRQENS